MRQRHSNAVGTLDEGHGCASAATPRAPPPPQKKQTRTHLRHWPGQACQPPAGSAPRPPQPLHGPPRLRARQTQPATIAPHPSPPCRETFSVGRRGGQGRSSSPGDSTHTQLLHSHTHHSPGEPNTLPAPVPTPAPPAQRVQLACCSCGEDGVRLPRQDGPPRGAPAGGGRRVKQAGPRTAPTLLRLLPLALLHRSACSGRGQPRH